jgi:cytochrome c553
MGCDVAAAANAQAHGGHASGPAHPGTLQGDETMLMLKKGRRRRMPNGPLARVLLPAAVLVMVGIGGAKSYAADDSAAVSAQAVDAKLKYCEVCHGASARGFVGFYPIPRLAGQPVEYIENELKGFSEQKRMNKQSPGATNVMFHVGHVLSPAMVKALATRFHELNPDPVGGAPQQDIAAGKKIFTEGVGNAKVPPCASCHGPDAKGNGPIPRLAGQLYPYVVKQLTDWPHERTETNSDIMAPIAHELTKTQIEAVAAYVSSLH